MLDFSSMASPLWIPDFREVAVSATEPRIKPLPAFVGPYLDRQDIHFEIIDGCLIIHPVEKEPVGHLLHFHGIGGVSEHEMEWACRLAAGKVLGQPLTIVLPMSNTLARHYRHPLKNIRDLKSLSAFMLQQPPEVQAMLRKAMAKNKQKGQEGLSDIIRTIVNPDMWYSCVFETVSTATKTTVGSVEAVTNILIGAKNASAQNSAIHLRPAIDPSIGEMLDITEKIGPRINKVLKQVGAIDELTFVSGFSQGVGLAVLFAAYFNPDRFPEIVAICGPYVASPTQNLIKDRHIQFTGYYPTHDPVFEIFRPLAASKKEIADAFAGGGRVTTLPGDHRIEGHIGHASALRIVSGLSRKNRERLEAKARTERLLEHRIPQETLTA